MKPSDTVRGPAPWKMQARTANIHQEQPPRILGNRAKTATGPRNGQRQMTRGLLKMDRLYLHLFSVLCSTRIRIRAHFRSDLNPTAGACSTYSRCPVPVPGVTFEVFGRWQIGNLVDQHAPQQSALWNLYLYTMLALPIKLLPAVECCHGDCTARTVVTQIQTKVSSSRKQHVGMTHWCDGSRLQPGQRSSASARCTQFSSHGLRSMMS
jgi:hypothetical protein